MCFTVAIHATREEIENRFGASFEDPSSFTPGYYFSAFTYPRLPVISGKNNQIINMFTWGLIPSWVKDESYAEGIRSKTLNAKSETITEKPSFRNALKTGRCMVISKGFFEWQQRDNKKIPYYIGLKDEQLFGFAGLYDIWINPATGETNYTFTIITTSANPLLAEIHNTKQRMPVILPNDREQEWIDPKVPADKALELLRPYNQEMMTAWTVSRLVSTPGANKNLPEVIEPYNWDTTK
jgi:putative SOS response-associated peptidase YedK